MQVVLARDAAMAVIRAAGLPVDQCMGFTVEFRPDAVVTLRAEYAAGPDAVAALERVIRDMPLGRLRVEIAQPEGQQTPARPGGGSKV